MPMGLVVILAVCAAYIAVLNVIPYSQLSPVLNAFRLVTSIAVFLLYAWTGLRAAWKPFGKTTATDHLLIGVSLCWGTAAMFAVSNDVSRVLGWQMSILHSPITGLAGVLMVLAGVFHLTAPGFVTPYRVMWAVVFSVGLVVVLQFALWMANWRFTF